jgi:Cu/Ag efflux protein CusF
MKSVKATLVAAVLGSLLPGLAAAQKAVSKGDMIEVKAKITAIDSTKRLVTLKDEDGVSETIHAGPEVKRFDDLKIGDTVTFRYYESIVYEIRKPGTPAKGSATDTVGIVRGQGKKPAATVSEQINATVTVKAINPKTPSITVQTEDGDIMSFQVEDPKNLKGVAVGDRVEITYTAAVMITVQ